MLLSDKAKQLVEEKYKDNHKDRLEHIYGVVEMATYLAEKYNVDIEKAKIAAYMHDYSKYDDFDTAALYLDDKDIKECEKYPFLFHAYLSAEAYIRLLGSDMDIYNAIRYHVFGREKMSMLEAIIMIADYTEKNRKYKECIETRKILLEGNFNLAIYKSLENTINHCKEKGEEAHPMQLLVFEEYKRKIQNLSKIDLIIDAISKVKAHDIIVYDSKYKNPFYDNIIIASVDSKKQATAAISYVYDRLKENNYLIRNTEGYDTEWVLIDMYDVILSIFTNDERKHFELEKIYMEYPKKEIKI